MPKIQIVLVEWMGYPLFRNKTLGQHTIQCGLGRLLKNMQRFQAGADFECTVIFNEFQPLKNNKIITCFNQFNFFKPWLINNVQTNSRDKYDALISEYSFVKQVIYRENQDQDIGAYDVFYNMLKTRKHESDVLFINSSTRGPSDHGWLAKYRDLFYRQENTGLCGISLNSHDTSIEKPPFPFMPHVQSFFLYTNMSVLTSVFPNGLLTKQNLKKGELIALGELEISTKVLEAGFGISSSAFPDFYYQTGDTWSIPEGDIRFQPEYYHLANAC